MSIPEWEEIGIPQGYGPDRLLYNQPSETVIIELRSVGKEFLPNRIYIRRQDAAKYEPIKIIEQMQSCESVVTPSGSPVLFYLFSNLKKWEGSYAGDWKGLYRFDILDRKETEIVIKGSLLLPPPYNRGWVSSLVSASEDASQLVLVVAMTVESDAPESHMVNYHLAKMDLATKQVHLISHLRGAFF